MVALFSAHTQGNNSIEVVNTLVILTGIQFYLIVTYHIITFALKGWIISKLQPYAWVNKHKEILIIGRDIQSSRI